MSPAVRSMIATAYVADLGKARAFYEVLGFREARSGKSDGGAWSLIRNGENAILLASTRPPIGVPQLPLSFYLFVDDLGAVSGALRAAGAEPVSTGHPPHAPGGELRVADPDGNTLLVGQQERPGDGPPAEEDEDSHFSVLREAAALIAARGGTTASCAVPGSRGALCGTKAEVKLADSAGESAWVCLPHAEEILVTVPGAFIASTDSPGLAGFLSRYER